MSATAAGDPQSNNLYAYAGNNPIDNIDPSGLFGGAMPPPGVDLAPDFADWLESNGHSGDWNHLYELDKQYFEELTGNILGIVNVTADEDRQLTTEEVSKIEADIKLCFLKFLVVKK